MINPFNLINQIQAKFVGLMLAALCLSNVVSAQTANEKKHENTWEIGIDVLPLIRDTSHHIRESILVKRKIYDDLMHILPLLMKRAYWAVFSYGLSIR